ncbi:ATP-dependent DNA helicase DDM1 [Tanacetum coccineum]
MEYTFPSLCLWSALISAHKLGRALKVALSVQNKRFMNSHLTTSNSNPFALQNPQIDLQAMDRCHRIGQTKPVHVYRLVTTQSVEGRMLKRAFSNLKLEHVVIGKGHFKQKRTKASSTKPMEEEEIVALLKSEEDAKDKKI